MRTLNLGPQNQNNQPSQDHTSWVDLISNKLREEQYTMLYITDEIENDRSWWGKRSKLYRIRWEGYDGTWDTWEPEDQLKGTQLLKEYLEAKADDNNPNNKDLPEVTNTTPAKWFTKARLALMNHRISHGINKVTANKWESIWADALPIGNGRCNKKGEDHATCLACLLLTGTKEKETTRHAHLDCPTTKRTLSMIYKCYIQTTATNLDSIRETRKASDNTIMEQHGLELLTGYRLKDTARGSPNKRSGDTPFTVYIAETHAAIHDRRTRNEKCEEEDQLDWSLDSIYKDIRYRMTTHMRNTKLEANRLQTKRRIDNPSKKLDKEGPWFEWNDQWVKTGWCDKEGWNLMPKEASDIEGTQYTHSMIPDNEELLCCKDYPDECLTQDTLIIYTDGSHDSGKPQATAGFGYIGVRGGDAIQDTHNSYTQMQGSGPVITNTNSRPYLGADKHTNNTGETTAIIEAMLWALYEDPKKDTPIVIRPDSQLAMGWIIGDIKANTNQNLVKTGQEIYKKLVSQRKGKVWWKWVKGHSDHLRNDQADRLADEGAQMDPWEATVSRPEWMQVRGDGGLNREHTYRGRNGRLDTKVSWEGKLLRISQCLHPLEDCKGWAIGTDKEPWDRTNQTSTEINTIVRVERSSDALGTLNLLPRKNINLKQIKHARDHAMDQTRLAQTKVGKERKDQALTKIIEAYNRLNSKEKLDFTINQIEKSPTNPIQQLWVPVDLISLKEFIAHPMSLKKHKKGTTNSGSSMRNTATRLANRIEHDPSLTTDEEGIKWINLHYNHCALGKRLVAAGHIKGSRVYATNQGDPFKFGRIIRYIALQRYGIDFDDSGCYPTGLCAKCPIGKEICSTFLKHRKHYLKQLGNSYFPHIQDQDELYTRMKTLMLALDFDGSIKKWEHDWNIHAAKQLGTQDRTLTNPDQTNPISFRTYVELVPTRTKWIHDHTPDMVNLIQNWQSNTNNQYTSEPTQIGRNRPEVTSKCFSLQELESDGREAKIREANYLGQRVLNLQHDGIVIGLNRNPELGRDTIKEKLHEAISKDLGYNQPVEGDTMKAPNPKPLHLWDSETLDTTARISKINIVRNNNPSLTTILRFVEKGPSQNKQTFSSYITITYKEDQTQPNQQYWEREALFNPTHNPEHTTLIELSRGYTNLKQGTWSNSPRDDQSSESETEETEAGDEDTNHNLTLTNPNNYTLNKANENNENTQTPPRHNPTPEQRTYQNQPNLPRNELPNQNITTTTNQTNTTPQTNNPTTNHNPIPPNPERNLAGDARRTGNQEGPPQCTLAAARNIIRNETLSEKELATYLGIYPRIYLRIYSI